MAALTRICSGRLVDRETTDQRRRALEAIVERVYREPSVRDERYRADREAARRRPSALGQRWRALLREHLAAMVGDPRLLNTLPHLDAAIARELAAELRRQWPTPCEADLARLLASAMLEGSDSLPDAPGACQDRIAATVQATCTARQGGLVQNAKKDLSQQRHRDAPMP